MSEDVTPDEFGRLRVTDEDTGHERSIQASELPHGNYKVLTGKDHPASDPLTGDAVPERLNPARAAADAPEGEGGEPVSKYDDLKVADLKAEVDRRNGDRDPADHIVPAPPGNKPELISALVADDPKED